MLDYTNKRFFLSLFCYIIQHGCHAYFIGTPTQENERRAEYNLKKLDKQGLKFILEEVARLLTKAPPGETGGFAPAWDNFERAILGSRPDLKITLQSFENSMLPTSRDRRSWQR
jgi:hypothetical protein